jgi:SAM-dependent methyltransferase
VKSIEKILEVIRGMNRIPFSRGRCLEVWGNRSNSDRDIGNRPIDYAGKDKRIVHFLVELAGSYLTPESRVLEVGCNAGTNLDGLFRAGFTKLYGIEINRNAIQEMGTSYPDLYRAAFKIAGDAVEVVRYLPDRYFDMVFSMAVLMHIHPSGSDSLFRDMARISDKYICTIEKERDRTVYIFPRNYKEIFESLGMVELYHEELDEKKAGEEYSGYTVRIFKHKSTTAG